MMCLLPACRQRHHVVVPAFYYWKTTYAPSGFEQHVMSTLGSRLQYIRLFDVDTDPRASGAYPVGMLRMKMQADSAVTYIPVVYVTQRVLHKLPAAQMEALAQKIARLAEAACAEGGIATTELQIDCDWTTTTREKYFALLSALRRQSFLIGKKLSCTIRLHQVKYTTSSGVPPVDRGVLMCYNVGNLRKPGDHNSILEAETALKYMARLDAYPLHLDIALPLFSWSLLFRGGQYVGILRDVDVTQLSGSTLFRKEGQHLYRCLQDTIWHTHTLYAGDVIRYEASDMQHLHAIAKHTAQRVHNDSLRVIYFSCDSLTLAKHSVHDLEKVLDRYR